jgi:tRNA 2-thiouridine synthesizing protein A
VDTKIPRMVACWRRPRKALRRSCRMAPRAVARRLYSLLKLGACRLPETAAMADQTLDTKGLACPLPILKVKKVLAGMPKGATLEVFATDPGSVPDFQAFSEATGNALLEHSEANGVYRFVLRHSAA